MILVYGNCQAGVYANLLKHFIGGNRTVRHVRSFDHPTEPVGELSREELAECTLVLEQVDAGRPMPEALRQGPASRTPLVRFPPLDFNLLWPFNFNDPRNVSEPPDYPFGRFPYGDRIVVELLREGLVGSALWNAYQERSVARFPDLERLQMHETRRLAKRDETLDVKVAQLVMSEFADKRLFWAINHPTGWLLGRAFIDILVLCHEHVKIDGDFTSSATKFFAGFEPFGHHHVPIHPEVARQLKLAWWTPEQRYRYMDGSMMTFEETMRRYIDFR